MLSLLNLKGSPSTTVLSAPTVYSPSFPALNLSPSLPLISPVISALVRTREVAEVVRIPQGELLDRFSHHSLLRSLAAVEPAVAP